MSSAAKPHQRPLSPFLIYRLPLTALLSISHRITGCGLAAGLLLLTWWVTAAAFGEPEYAQVEDVMGSWFGQLVLLGFTFALFFHLCNGIRHLFWDAGMGFDLKVADRANMIVIGGAIVLTLIAFVAAL
jgi:succinate dehydrogenase / fumarate reductase cytochrome b subunit